MPESPPEAVALDYLDCQAVSRLLPIVLEKSKSSIEATAMALAAEGGRGATARRLLAKEVAITQVRLRYYQSLLSIDVNWLCERRYENERRVRVLERIVAAEHRRLVTSLELLSRLDSPAPAITVRANQAAFVVGGTR